MTPQNPMQDAVRTLLAGLGEDPDREGLDRTPERVEKSLKFLTSGYGQDPKALINEALFTVSYDEMVLVKDIDVFSMCEHHLLPFYGKAHVAYIPNGKVVGLSKIPRLVDMFARRLQVQERLTVQIAETIQEVIRPQGRRRRHRGHAPLHDDARRREAELDRGDLLHARRVPRPPAHARGVPRADPPDRQAELLIRGDAASRPPSHPPAPFARVNRARSQPATRRCVAPPDPPLASPE